MCLRVNVSLRRFLKIVAVSRQKSLVSGLWQYRDKSHLCQDYGNITTRFTYVRTTAISRQDSLVSGLWQYRDKIHLCEDCGNIATRSTYVRTMAISRQGLRQYRDMCQTMLYSYRKTSWVILIAQCDGKHCTLQAFEQFGHIRNDWSAPCPQTRYVLLMLFHCCPASQMVAKL